MGSHLLEILLAAAVILSAVIGNVHAILYKRDSRAAVAWIGFMWLLPLAGPLLYYLIGVNRMRSRGGFLRTKLSSRVNPCSATVPQDREPLPDSGDLQSLELLGSKLNPRSWAFGNRIVPLVNGDAAYPEMLKAIEESQSSITLSTYIFDSDPVGELFVQALARAQSRSVSVRVLIDDIGSRYSFPSVFRRLRKVKITAERFLPVRIPWHMPFVNLRNHRKLLLVDGKTAFVGGMNIREGHWLSRQPKHPVRDLQFKIEGPVVTQFQNVFARDWKFANGERLEGAPWFSSEIPLAGLSFARAVSDGPDADFERIRWLMLGAISGARKNIQILTPYFLPDVAIITALYTAALRGVSIEIILPEKSNLPWVHWATQAILWQVLESGCRVSFSPPPFDHSKFMVVDSLWVMFGSSNWDPRSLRLNFELNVESFDRGLAEELEQLFQEKLRVSKQVTLSDLDGRVLPVRIRDGIARLFAPYL